MPYHYKPNQPRVPAGHHDGGQWTNEGEQPEERVQPVFLGPTFSLMVEASVNLYSILALQNSRDRQAVASFKARRYKPRDLHTGDNELDFDDVKVMNRDEVEDLCKRIVDVQTLTNKAVSNVRAGGFGGLPAAEYGTKVHVELKKLIDKPFNPDFRAELSVMKGLEEGKGYGMKDTVRVDVYERAKNETVCVYDIKTGWRGLSLSCMAEIATKVFEMYHKTQRIIVTEIRPQ